MNTFEEIPEGTASQLFADVLKEGLYPLVEGRYDRGGALLAKGWQAFCSPLEKQKEWMSAREIELHRTREIELIELVLSRVWNLEKQWQEEYQRQHKHPFDIKGMSAVWQKILDLQDVAFASREPDAFLFPTFCEMRQRRAEEIAIHVRGAWKKFDPESRASLKKLLREVATECGARLGYGYDRGLSTSDWLVLSRAAKDPWRLCLHLGGEDSRYQPPSRPRGKVAWFQELYPDMRLFFALHRDPPVYLPIHQPRVDLAPFFPIEEPPSYHFCREYANLEEMELVIRFNFAMAEIIQPELEPLLARAIDIIL